MCFYPTGEERPAEILIPNRSGHFVAAKECVYNNMLWSDMTSFGIDLADRLVHEVISNSVAETLGASAMTSFAASVALEKMDDWCETLQMPVSRKHFISRCGKMSIRIHL